MTPKKILIFLYQLVYVLPGRILTIIHSSLLSWLFASKHLSVHHSARIIGHDCINIGNYFWAGPDLWLHAVARYQGYAYSPIIEIGNHFGCSTGIHIAAISRVTIGENVLVGSYVLITDHNHGLYDLSEAASPPCTPPIGRPLYGHPVIIGNNVLIGDNVKILPGAKIEDGVIVACNAVVTGFLPSNSICAGVPAKPIKFYRNSTTGWTSINHTR